MRHMLLLLLLCSCSEEDHAPAMQTCEEKCLSQVRIETQKDPTGYDIRYWRCLDEEGQEILSQDINDCYPACHQKCQSLDEEVVD